MMKTACAALLTAGVVLAAAGGSVAQDMVYTPVNPSFGGSPLNSSHLLGLANAQRTATARTPGPGTDSTDPSDPGSTDADLFIRQLQSRLLSGLASQVTEAIFGDNPQDSGTVRFGETTVTFERTVDSIRLIITDPTGVTEIVVPLLVATNNTVNSLMQGAGGLESGNALSGGLNTGALSGDLTSSTSLSPGLN
ncbi:MULTISPECIES: curli assembly protein CsgF [unclassified Mesorhizobium]|uniref:curli assembly protein CsgF n=1 Tax=unclassified Mesorhizobium TaxID=325217 RepID=UPI001AED6947|nr:MULTISPECIES: curli assembly protein CsgF [unclassified Mesorhizobium]MBZ9704931.1 curli assembly protein CsgF [Mesorhizobium sp. CO1-1-3]MBZ9919489.1 curli assembly protein CsgF [Mesorhizobium sp. BR1-1-7]MBZ9951021.1 curli assembly protein CsgF [Mesorhizobium sp. BR1-1-11]MBZ9956394.1 curli assembly protein CsgF [Mesorhizobium sp. BR1-1-15]MBZ9973402.1 curli assembly protein CsgF [Mesorhizobium sp. BR1-1-12]